MWSFAAALAGLAMVALVLWDAFQTILLPRTVVGRFRLTRLFYRLNWAPWAAASQRMEAGVAREHFLSLFGPLSLLLLTGFWAGGLIVGFGLMHWATRAKQDFWPDLEFAPLARRRCRLASRTRSRRKTQAFARNP